MAIKINELRVENWVKGIVVGSMVQVDLSFFNEWYDHEENGDTSMGDWYQGIRLSPEILVACGFEKKKDRFIYKDTAIFCYWDGVEFVFKYGFDSDLCFAACEFLHELQNLIYALLKEELPFKPN